LERSGVGHESGSVRILSFQMLEDIGAVLLGEPMVRVIPGESMRRSSEEGLLLCNWRREGELGARFGSVAMVSSPAEEEQGRRAIAGGEGRGKESGRGRADEREHHALN
jgi:hypothetical protein